MDARVRSISALAGIFLTASTAAAGQTFPGLGASVFMADPDAPQEVVVIGAKASREAADNRVICKVQKRMNTRFVEKNCQTHRQWEQLREEHIRAAHEMIDRPLISGQ